LPECVAYSNKQNARSQSTICCRKPETALACSHSLAAPSGERRRGRRRSGKIFLPGGLRNLLKWLISDKGLQGNRPGSRGFPAAQTRAAAAGRPSGGQREMV